MYISNSASGNDAQAGVSRSHGIQIEREKRAVGDGSHLASDRGGCILRDEGVLSQEVCTRPPVGPRDKSQIDRVASCFSGHGRGGTGGHGL